ncbi:2-succinyl-6-hydroxy-2,4-cyclohexadiene-1-carboxylate synthase [Peribacillus sp. SCS-26]|uniref:2-succinyl-6-hydroxy-2, 4-cyclohexadiene-1-carboxylate synthase n=1 Tax=Paraperibacillus marinus TaxID=3115295 RepID=UPI003906A034
MKIEAGGVSYMVTVCGEGPALVLLHGFTGSSSNWRFAAPFLPSGYKRIAIDIIGHGRSSSPGDPGWYRIEKAAEAVNEILDSLDIQRACILGYSMGGRLALCFSILYPERVQALILESASPGLKTESERAARRIADAELAEGILKDGIDLFAERWGAIPLFQTQAEKLTAGQKDFLKKQRLLNNPVGLAGSLKGMGTGSQPSYWDRLGDLKVPVLLLSGSLDRKFCTIAGEMDRLMPDSIWAIIEDAGHAIHLEQPEVYGRKITDFFAKNE